MLNSLWNYEFGVSKFHMSPKEVVKHPLFSGSAVMIGGSLAINFINYLYHLVMARFLGPIDYGSLASVFSILYIAAVIPTSASFSIVKFVSSSNSATERRDFYWSAKKLFLAIAIVATTLAFIFNPIISNFLHFSNSAIIMLVAPITFFTVMVVVNQASLQGLLKFSGVVIPNLVSAIVKFALGLMFIYLGYSVLGALGAVLIASIISYFVSESMVRGRFGEHKKARSCNLAPFVKYAIPVLLQALAFVSIFTLDIILVRHFLPPFEAGLYAAIATLGKIIFWAAMPVTSVMFPIVSGRKSRGEDFMKVLSASFAVTLAISLVVIGFYWLFPNIAIGVLYGSEYLSASSLLVWMGLFMTLYTLCYFLVSFLLSINKEKIVVLPLLVAVVQVIAIVNWHESLYQILIINTTLMTALLIGLGVYIGYNRVSNYAKIK